MVATRGALLLPINAEREIVAFDLSKSSDGEPIFFPLTSSTSHLHSGEEYGVLHIPMKASLVVRATESGKIVDYVALHCNCGLRLTLPDTAMDERELTRRFHSSPLN